eukprot:9461425-Pyramimonas_sp.AAC.1
MSSGKFDFAGAAETHVSEPDASAWDMKARRAGLKLLANPARGREKRVSKQQQPRSNEGGEWMLRKGHLQMHSLLSQAGARPLRAAGHQHLDGFQAIVVHMSGYSVAIITFYGHPSYGFRGPTWPGSRSWAPC